MKIHILSDIHTEFSDFDPPETDADVVVLAGDIGVGSGGIQWAERRYPKVPVIYVPGNHEFDGVRFLGSTLWTDFKLYGEGEAWFSRRRAGALIEDFVSIKSGGLLFTPEDSVELHEASKAGYPSESSGKGFSPGLVVEV
jgi:predicted phosphodiesterase